MIQIAECAPKFSGRIVNSAGSAEGRTEGDIGRVSQCFVQVTYFWDEISVSLMGRIHRKNRKIFFTSVKFYGILNM